MFVTWPRGAGVIVAWQPAKFNCYGDCTSGGKGINICQVT